MTSMQFAGTSEIYHSPVQRWSEEESVLWLGRLFDPSVKRATQVGPRVWKVTNGKRGSNKRTAIIVVCS